MACLLDDVRAVHEVWHSFCMVPPFRYLNNPEVDRLFFPEKRPRCDPKFAIPYLNIACALHVHAARVPYNVRAMRCASKASCVSHGVGTVLRHRMQLARPGS